MGLLLERKKEQKPNACFTWTEAMLDFIYNYIKKTSTLLIFCFLFLTELIVCSDVYFVLH